MTCPKYVECKFGHCTSTYGEGACRFLSGVLQIWLQRQPSDILLLKLDHYAFRKHAEAQDVSWQHMSWGPVLGPATLRQHDQALSSIR